MSFIKRFNEFLNENSQMIPKSQNYMRLEDFPEDIKIKLENWIDTEVVNWEESADDENESEAVQYAGENERFLTDIIIYKDGSFTPIIYQINNPRDNYLITWENEDGEEESNDFLNYLNGPIIWLKDFKSSDTKGIADKDRMPLDLRKKIFHE